VSSSRTVVVVVYRFRYRTVLSSGVAFCFGTSSDECRVSHAFCVIKSLGLWSVVGGRVGSL